MKILEGIDLLKAQLVFGRTPKGRPLTDYAKEVMEAVLQDEKNHDAELTKCLGCGFIVSILLTSEGCPNCGVQDMTMNIKNETQEIEKVEK